MASFQIIECSVALAGDEQHIVRRGLGSPVTYPEMLVLQFLHGDTAVTDANELRREDRDNQEEFDRLTALFGKKVMSDVFPGARPRLPTDDPRIRVRTAPTPPKRRAAPTRDPGGATGGAMGGADNGDDIDSLRPGE